jgi:hypothetical protein
VRWRHLGIKENIPKSDKGGFEMVKGIIKKRVAQGGGYQSTYAGEKAIFYKDGGVTYVFRLNGEFWTILVNK